MLEILGVKRANYYKWLRRNKSERDLENEELAVKPQTLHIIKTVKTAN